jgi:hypothetical protein
VVTIERINKTSAEDLSFVRKYCFARTYPASDERCRYAKVKILAKPSKASAGEGDPEEIDGIFLCRYPDEKMPTHQAQLTSELAQCPNMERREMIDALYSGKV